jgi:hypothetical protein
MYTQEVQKDFILITLDLITSYNGNDSKTHMFHILFTLKLLCIDSDDVDDKIDNDH